MRKVSPGRPRGFTLIELMIVLVVMFILASMLIPLYLSALQKAKQRRTMAEMDGLGKVMMSFITDQAAAGAAGASGSVDMGDYPGPVPHSDLEELLVPQYTQELMKRDGWKNPFEIYLDPNATGAHLAAVRSPARGGTFSADSYSVGPFAPTDFNQDLVWADGYFVRWPE